ncbi:hypothetical protein ACSBR2_011161 [Camellia fascicularis]
MSSVKVQSETKKMKKEEGEEKEGGGGGGGGRRRTRGGPNYRGRRRRRRGKGGGCQRRRSGCRDDDRAEAGAAGDDDRARRRRVTLRRAAARTPGDDRLTISRNICSRNSTACAQNIWMEWFSGAEKTTNPNVFSGAEKTTNPNVFLLLSPTVFSHISNLNKIIRDLLYRITNDWAPCPSLVQFWARITTKEGRSFLTTRNQPFSLTSFWYEPVIEGLLGYRMICMDSKFDIDLDGGTSLLGGVFKYQFHESTPNVEFYSITEYPQRDDALRCGVRESFAFPVFESSTQRCVGVIEVVAPPEEGVICNSYFRYGIYKDFEEFGLKCSVVFDHEDMELDEDENEARTIALDEIKNVLKMVCDVHDLPLAHAWVPCEVGCPCRALVDGGILHASCYYKKDDYGEDEDEDEDEDDYGEDKNAFHHISSSFHLKNGVAVVGRALLSTNMVFCRDVAQLSLTEYPLAHYARNAGLSGCLAICLESNCTGNDVYVLEFFMPMSNNASENPHTSLRKILETMRKNFRCLRVATRGELEEELHIEEISIQNGEKLDPVQIPQTTISLPQLELSQSEVEVMQVDSSDQQLVNAINTGSNVFGTEHNNIAITCTQERDTVKASKRKGNKSGGTVKASTRKNNKTGVKIEISLEEILQTSKMKLEDAAQSLGASKSTLKRACREYGIDRWPPCNINKAGRYQLNELARVLI